MHSLPEAGDHAAARTERPCMTCREFIEHLNEFLSEDLSEERRRLFDHHLGVCPSCVAYLESYRRTIELGKEAFADLDAQVPGDVPEELVQAILAARRPH